MKALIIYAHPYEKSFNHAILERIIEGLEVNKHEIKIIDLYQENFNPVFKKEELALYRKGEYLDKKIGEYQKSIETCDYIFFIFPIWWASMPSILKGFIDKVFLPGWAYERGKMGLITGKLRHIKKAFIIHTMNSPSWYYRYFYKNPIKNIMVKDVLKGCGVKRVKIIRFGSIIFVNNKKREKYLKKAYLIAREIK
jgi:putative NADPH-quinone reductase